MTERVRITRRTNGAGSLYFASPKGDIRFFSSGSKLLDLALGGGWAEDRVINIVGDRSSGKTLLCIEACANFARAHTVNGDFKGRMKYRETERAFLHDYAQALGMPIELVDFGRGYITTVEDLFEDLERTIDTAKRSRPTLYIVDSLDALSDRDELERDISKGSYGAKKAKTLSELFRRLNAEGAERGVTLMIVSQIRDKIGVVFGKPQTRAGGKAMDFYASQVIWLYTLGKEERTYEGVKRSIGVNVRAKVDKNKVGLPFREAEFNILFGYGIDDLAACCAWMKQAKALDRIDIPADYEPYLKKLARRGEPREIRALTKEVYQEVEKRWYEVETSFLPKHRKYD